MKTVITGNRWAEPLVVAACVVMCARARLAQSDAGQLASAQQERDAGDGRGQYAHINGAHIYYEVTGEGPPSILIHGYPLNDRLFREQRRELSKDFQVITLDLRGFSRSTVPHGVASIRCIGVTCLDSWICSACRRPSLADTPWAVLPLSRS